MKYSVLTADVIDSGKLDADLRKKIFETLKHFVSNANNGPKVSLSISRGDNIQGVFEDPSSVLRYGLSLQSLFKSFSKDGDKRKAINGIRISIGIGEISYWGDTISESDGPAFQYSGRSLDEMKNEERLLKLTTKDEDINEKWNVILKLMEEIIINWTRASAEVVHYLLENLTEEEISKKLGISQPAVNYRKKHSGWNAISNTISYFEKEFSICNK